MGNLKNKRILVTGGSGYLGQHLIRSLQNEGALVFNISFGCEPSEFDFDIDITRFEDLKSAVKKINPQFIYHLAASLDRSRGLEKFDEVMKVNLMGTSNLLKALESMDYQNFIFTSSSEVYGNRPSPLLESMELDPVSPYSMSKVFGEMLLKAHSQLNKHNYTILRLFNFYGSGMPESFFIPQMVQTLMRGESFEMTSGEQRRDFIHVDDVVRALILCGNNSNAHLQTFNVCSGKGVQLRQLAQLVASNLNQLQSLKIGALPYRENEVWEMVGDSKKIERELGFKAEISLVQGIKSLIERS